MSNSSPVSKYDGAISHLAPAIKMWVGVKKGNRSQKEPPNPTTNTDHAYEPANNRVSKE